jgi:hypothetical protein
MAQDEKTGCASGPAVSLFPSNGQPFPSVFDKPDCYITLKEGVRFEMDRGGTQAAMKAVVEQCGIKKSLHSLPEARHISRRNNLTPQGFFHLVWRKVAVV